MRTSERLVWAADVVDPAPGERILEVGCGPGALVALLAARLTTGVVVGVDPSAAMIATAGWRNRAAVAAGRVRLQTASLTGADLGEQAFDVVVSSDVGAFGSPPGQEWDVVRRVLVPEGRVVITYQPVAAAADRSVEEAVRRLAGRRGFDLVAVHRGRTAPVASVALELRGRPAG